MHIVRLILSTFEISQPKAPVPRSAVDYLGASLKNCFNGISDLDLWLAHRTPLLPSTQRIFHQSRLQRDHRDFDGSEVNRVRASAFSSQPGPTPFSFWNALRLLANSYKHDPWAEPDEELLKLLKLDTRLNYAPLPESEAVQEGLARFLGLKNNVDYCDIAEQFVAIIDRFLAEVKEHANLSRVKRVPISINPRDALY